MKKTLLIAGGVSVVSLAAGLVGGFLYAKKLLVAAYNEQMEAEIKRQEKYFSAVYKKGEFADPAALVEVFSADEAEKAGLDDEKTRDAQELVRVLTQTKYNRVSAAPAKLELPKDPPVETKSIFVDRGHDESDEAFQAAVAARTTKAPYIISHDEYMANEKEYRQITVTYYAGDEVLVDAEDDQPIVKAERSVGVENLQFGLWSGDQNVVYIRSDPFECEFEVLYHEGKYSEVVLGLTE